MVKKGENMKEIYLKQNRLLPSITLKFGHGINEYININSVDDMLKYFNHDNLGKSLKDRKNLNIVLCVDDDSKRKLLEEKLSVIEFKKAYVSYDLPYEEAKKKYELNAPYQFLTTNLDIRNSVGLRT